MLLAEVLGNAAADLCERTAHDLAKVSLFKFGSAYYATIWVHGVVPRLT